MISLERHTVLATRLIARRGPYRGLGGLLLFALALPLVACDASRGEPEPLSVLGADVPCIEAACPSHVCAPSGGCAAPSGVDGVQNGGETDLDCGGEGRPKCAVAQRCASGCSGIFGMTAKSSSRRRSLFSLKTVTTCSCETGSAPSTPTSWSVTIEMFA